jgi:hypothetical protein
MSAKAGELDFSKLAQEAKAALDTEPVVKSKAKVASSEGGVPQPQVAQMQNEVETEIPENENETQDLEATETTETTETETTEVESKTVKSQDENADQVLDLPDTAKVKVKIDGQEQIISYGEYKDRLRKEATVTQRMQQFAKSREEFNQTVQETLRQFEAREAALKAKAETRDPLYDTILNALKGQVAPKERDPNEIVTLGDVKAERERLAKEFADARQNDKAQFEQMLAQAAQSVQAQAAAQKERQAYLGGLGKILGNDQYAALREVVPNLEASVMFHVQHMAPNNLEEALEYSEDYIKDRAKAFAKFTVAQEQKQQAKAVKQKMESSDGASPTIVSREKSPSEKAKQFVGKNGKLDWKAMEKESLARMNSMN